MSDSYQTPEQFQKTQLENLEKMFKFMKNKFYYGNWKLWIIKYAGEKAVISSDDINSIRDLISYSPSIKEIHFDIEGTDRALEDMFLARFSGSSSIIKSPDGYMDANRRQRSMNEWLSEKRYLNPQEVKVVNQICESLNGIVDDTKRDIVIARAIFGFSIEQIARVKNESSRNIYNKYNSAINESLIYNPYL